MTAPPGVAVAGPTNSLLDVAGLRVGQHTAIGHGFRTGTTVVLAPEGGMVAGVDVRGGGPATHETDREAIETALSCIGLTAPENARVIRIKNTLMLGEIEVSEAYLPEVAKRGDLTPLGDPTPLGFEVTGTIARL